MTAESRARVERLLAAARRLADPSDALGREARAVLPASSRLSPEGVELALAHCLETQPSEAELDALCRSVPPSSRSHVVLSANVFTAAHRALAVALAASPEVYVRPSRREPEMARLLLAGAPGLFELVRALAAGPGEQVFAYGADETLAALGAALPAHTWLHAHGHGFGLVAVEAASLSAADAHAAALARALALDTALFDQRGCLSPRLVLCEGTTAQACALAAELARALERRELETPVGELLPDERAALAEQRLTLGYAGELLPAGSGYVAVLDASSAEPPEPCARSLIVQVVGDAAARARELATKVTTYAAAGSSTFVQRLARALPRARASAPGRMQMPPFDGAVDRRRSPFA